MISLLQGLKKPFPVVVTCICRYVLGTCILGYIMAFLLNMRELGVWWSWFIVAWSTSIIIYLHGIKVLKQTLASSQDTTSQ